METKKAVKTVKKWSKNMQVAHKAVKSGVEYTIEDAVAVLKKVSYLKFVSTVEISVKLNIDTRKSDQNVRGTVCLPHGTGKAVKVCVICDPSQYEEATNAGADKVGGQEIVEEIKAGVIDFDVCIASPSAMRFLGEIAKILGPKGLMPNPKLGTLTPKIGNAVTASKAGRVEFRAERSGVVNLGVGKLDFPVEHLQTNIKTVIEALLSAKPKDTKGRYVISLYLSSTMGPGIKLDRKSLDLGL